MPPIRSVLWIGRGRRFAGDLVADAATLDVVWEAEVETALALPFDTFDAVVLDAEGPEAALRDLGRLRRKRPLPPLLVRIDAGEAGSVPALLARGAADVLLRTPPSAGEETSGELVERIERLARNAARAAAEDGGGTRSRSPSPSIVGDSREMREVYALVECAGRSRATVLVTGETGTGKELVARAIHDGSPRRERAFVAFNCAAFTDTLLESELFGHEKGAFTGADREKKGLVVTADRGTLFLDEVSETSRPFQAKLLRALQEREVRAVGSARARSVDVRVIAASNRDLWGEVCLGRFREDLFYRLAVFPIHVPPLRERPGDVTAIAEFFLDLHGRRERKGDVKLSRDAAHLLQAYRWPGNVRELENEIQRALALATPGDTLTPAHFSRRLFELKESVDAASQAGETLREALQRIEALLIRRALDAHGGRRAVTARSLGITREGLYKKMQRFGIT
jgi:transcriptional regulator with PAS, ATPase and Fis domain